MSELKGRVLEIIKAENEKEIKINQDSLSDSNTLEEHQVF